MCSGCQGVDYESLDQAAQEYAVKRLEAALKIFGPGFHVYQYLFKTNRPTVPFQDYADPVVQIAVEQRKQYFAQKLVDPIAAWFQRGHPSRYSITIRYDDREGNSFEERITHNLEIYKDLGTISYPGGSHG